MKPVLDALDKHIYFNDRQIERIWVQKFEPGRIFQFRNPSAPLAEALEGKKPLPLCAIRKRHDGWTCLMSNSMPPLMPRLEEAVFQSILPKLEAEGFSVFINPSTDMLPSFLSTYNPDAVAYKGDRKIAIEVLRDSQSDSPKIERIRKIFSDHPECEFRLVYAPPRNIEGDIPVSSRDLIDERLRQIEVSLEAMGDSAAPLVAWATFEAAARRLAPTNFVGPQGPTRLIEILAFEGYITPDEADTLRGLSPLRNQVAYGRLDIVPSREQIEKLIAVTRDLLRLDD